MYLKQIKIKQKTNQTALLGSRVTWRFLSLDLQLSAFPFPDTWDPKSLPHSCPALPCPPFLQDGLSLGRSEQPHPICSFQDDLQEFEMIDDNEEEEEEDEEEDEEEGEGEDEVGGGPDSQTPALEPLIPSPSLEEPHKHRPTTLHLTALGAQVSTQTDRSLAPALKAGAP